VALTTEELDFAVTAMLCDSAVTAEGKLYLQGAGWDMINPPSGTYPTRVPRVGLGLLIAVPYTATNRNHTMRISLKGADGEEIALGLQPADPTDPTSVGTVPMYYVEANFNVGRPPHLQSGESQTIPFAMNLDGLAINQPGSYSFVIEIDQREVQRLTFRATPVQQRPIVMGPR
jgi:Family of unknown function (DUF6941)